MAFLERMVISSCFGVFSCFLVLFQLIGFLNFPLALHQTTGLTIGEHSWSSSIWWIIQLALTVLSALSAKHNYNNLFNGLLLTDAMNNYFKFVFGLLTVCVTLADSWFGIETHRSIWIRYRELATRNETFLGLIGKTQLVRVLVRFYVAVLVIVAVCAFVEFKMYYGVGYGSQWHYFWTHNMYPYTISHFRHVYHLLHIMLMETNLRQLQHRLGNLQTFGETECMEAYRAMYGELWQINEGINELFGFSQALNVACSFAQIAFDIYWIYAMWITDLKDIELQMYCLIPTPVIIGFLMHAAKSYLLAMNAVEATLLDMNCREDLRMDQLRYVFLTQLRRTRIRLTAKGIFDFDYTLIRKLVTVILTYVIIFTEMAR
uniref:Gustatory receptor n=1 Tax=Anopheles minimus TaxID=112268 RepID=A0A182WGS8_9DIPT